MRKYSAIVLNIRFEISREMWVLVGICLSVWPFLENVWSGITNKPPPQKKKNVSISQDVPVGYPVLVPPFDLIFFFFFRRNHASGSDSLSVQYLNISCNFLGLTTIRINEHSMRNQNSKFQLAYRKSHSLIGDLAQRRYLYHEHVIQEVNYFFFKDKIVSR